ncbi:MAG: MBL fold metallo-hydrolase [Nitrosomonas sp.]|nr:MBL fold metallo-hydrolase [Nitrosomonas sp.]
MQPSIQGFFDPVTATVSYVVFDQPSGHCAIIDPVLDYDPKSGRTSHHAVDKLIDFVRSNNLTVDWILETHAHADHLSSAHYLKTELGGKTAIGDKISMVQTVFKKMFNLEKSFSTEGAQFDHLFADGECFDVGNIRGRAIFVPGHTPADLAYQFEDAIFIGDTMFMPDTGTARADFPGGDARQLYRSIRKLLDYPPETRLFMCHDYPAGGRPVKWESTVADERVHNVHVRDGISEEEFVAVRTARDATLGMPVLIFPSVQINVRAGQLPPAEDNGAVYLKIPVNLL